VRDLLVILPRRQARVAHAVDAVDDDEPAAPRAHQLREGRLDVSGVHARLIPEGEHPELIRVGHELPRVVGLREQGGPQAEGAIRDAAELPMLERFRLERPNARH
jgi:hypothetical protein